MPVGTWRSVEAATSRAREETVMSDSIRLDDLKVDANNLYKEEVFSDLRVATRADFMCRR